LTIRGPSACSSATPACSIPLSKPGDAGTEEAKTNDVTGKFKRGEYGLLLEFGRPCTGTRFTEVEKITTALCALGLPLIEDNPIAGLLKKDGSGSILEEYLHEKVLSAIVEASFQEGQLQEIIRTILPILEDVDTVVSVGIVSRFDEDGKLSVIDRLGTIGVPVRPNAKINVGLGRPLID
jgi:hypothetical protein